MKKKKLEARRRKQAIEKKGKFKKKIIWALVVVGVSVGCAFFLSEKKEKIAETIIEKSVESTIDKAADQVKEKAVEKITDLFNNNK